MMGMSSVSHWLILLVVVVLVFGTKKLRGAGKDLGGAVKGFKDAVKDETANQQQNLADGSIDSTASEKTKQTDKV